MSRRVVVASLLWIAAARNASADPVAVKVVDAGGDRIFVEPGEAAGLRVGTRVRIDAKQFVVVEVNEQTAALQLDGSESGRVEATRSTSVAIGATGNAEVVAARAVREPSAFVEQWPASVPPASLVKPRSVPLGGGADDATRITAIVNGYAVAAASSSGAGEARVIATFDRFGSVGGRALGAELDVAARVYSKGANDAEHVPVFVRAAQLSLGNRDGGHAAIGRLRYAATSVGMLDGARVGASFGRTTVAAFGGLAPDPLGAIPELGASRFGAEATYEDLDGAWQPRLAIAAIGSTWDGELDERRVVASGSVSRDRVWLDGFAEVQAFASDNAFGADAVELAGAGANVAWRDRGGTHAGASVGYLRPERTARIAAALPLGWLCVASSADACIGGDRWITASVSAGARRARWSVDGVATLGHSRMFSVDELADASEARAALDASGYLRAEWRGRPGWRLFVAPSAARTDFADLGALEIGAGIVRERLELAMGYRPEVLAERGADDAIVLHSITGELRYAASRAVDLSVALLGTTGPDRDLVALLGTLAWRIR